MKLVKSQTLFIQSKNRVSGGSTFNFDIHIPENYVSCSSEQLLKITLMNFSTYRSWYTINTGYNTISFKNLVTLATTVVIIPAGNYNYKVLASTINSLYPATVCSWNSYTNKLTFTFTQNHEVSFPDLSYMVLGFNQGAVLQGTTITSQTVIKPTVADHICIHLKDVTPYLTFNLDNLAGNGMNVSDVIMAMTVTTQPFDLVVWRNTNDEFMLTIKEKKLNSLRFYFTDFDNNALTYLPESQLVLRVDTYDLKEDETLRSALEDIAKYTRLSFISNNLQK